jgi:hypothetical protein
MLCCRATVRPCRRKLGSNLRRLPRLSKNQTPPGQECYGPCDQSDCLAAANMGRIGHHSDLDVTCNGSVGETEYKEASSNVDGSYRLRDSCPLGES